jgi:hypothetical protein
VTPLVTSSVTVPVDVQFIMKITHETVNKNTKQFVLKGAVSPVWKCIIIVWLNMPRWGHVTLDLKKKKNYSLKF